MCAVEHGGIAQLVRAPALQAGGHRFESCCPHQRDSSYLVHIDTFGPVVQLVRTLACHARGRRFEPVPGRQYASVAQLVEQRTENPRVIGSIPIGGTRKNLALRQGFFNSIRLCGRVKSSSLLLCLDFIALLRDFIKRESLFFPYSG